MEIELKLLLDPADIAAFRRHALLRQYAITKPRVQQLTSTYFDTDDFHFKRHAIALRVRRINREWVQTIKGEARVSAGLHQRQEWERSLNGPHPDLTLFKDQQGYGKGWTKSLTDSSLTGRLIPVFSTKVRRTIWLLRLEHGSEVELVLDQGEVRGEAPHDKAVAPISEIELELKSGDAGELFDFALQLQQSIPLRIGNISKSERGYALHAVQAPPAATAARLKLASNLSVEQSFQIIAANCLMQIQGNEAGVGTAKGNAPENIHQMRLGLRRLLSVLGLFAAVAPCPPALTDELKWLAGELGAARDWDVLAGETLDGIVAACPDEPGLTPLQQAAVKQAQKKRRAAAATLNSVRYARLMLAFGNWMHGAYWRTQPGGPMRARLEAPLAKFAAKMLAQREKQLVRRSQKLQDAEHKAKEKTKETAVPETSENVPRVRHRMRIAVKKTRYAIEFFESLYPARQIRPFIKALSGLQTALGHLNDASIAAGLLQSLGSTHASTAQAAGFAQAYLVLHMQRDSRKIGKLWKRFAAIPLPHGK
ncbi:MAG TPA: CHAD domain-containing protein [Herbaspirillum sp.]